MKRQLIVSLAVLFAISCGNAQDDRARVAELKKAQTNYQETSQRLLESLDYIARPLETLTDEQKASVAALVFLTRVAAEDPTIGLNGLRLIDQISTELPEYCPPIPEVTVARFGDCRDAELAYGVSMARCLEDDNKSEAECAKESAGDLSVAVMCRFKEISDIPGVIGLIPGRDWPPSPIPWPIDLVHRP